MRSQLATPLFFIFIFTLVLATAILAERPSVRSTLIPSPYLTQFSERDPWIARRVRLGRAFLKQRRRFESFCRWVWDLVAREVKPSREDIFHLRLQEDTVFLSTRDVEQFSAKFVELSVGDREAGDDDDIRDILRIIKKDLLARLPSERRLMIEYLRLKLLDHEALI